MFYKLFLDSLVDPKYINEDPGVFVNAVLHVSTSLLKFSIMFLSGCWCVALDNNNAFYSVNLFEDSMSIATAIPPKVNFTDTDCFR